ncbi:MAG: chorismate lyase [Gammaproteobacteria bacterium]|nr:chorismate lyase [Gammaproteobacteria bacterium]
MAMTVPNEWLTFAGSLTEKMEQFSQQKMQVALLRQGHQQLSSDELSTLQLKPRQWGWVREVELSFQAKPWVLARTVIPQSLMSSVAGRLRLLGDKPLGPVLFNGLKAQRRVIDFFQVKALHWSQQRWSQPLWCRRSLFYLDQRALLLKEVFLPAHPLYQQQQ